MIYATFYQYGVITRTELFPACGDRGTIILDGRHSLNTNKDIARTICKQRGYSVFQISKGINLIRDERKLTQLEKI